MTRRRKREIISLVVAVFVVAGGAALLFTNCGIQLGAPPAPEPVVVVAPGEPLEGNWSGTWSSTNSDDGGKLLCVIRKREDGKYDAVFHATFAKIFTYKMPVVLHAKPVAGGWEFEGEADLGWLHGGVYTYKGRVQGDNFESTYDSAFDKGTFRMRKVRASE